MGACEPDLSETLLRDELDRIWSVYGEYNDLRKKYPATWAIRWGRFKRAVRPLPLGEKRRQILRALENHHDDDGWMYAIDIAGELGWPPRQLKGLYTILAATTRDHTTECMMGRLPLRRPLYRAALLR